MWFIGEPPAAFGERERGSEAATQQLTADADDAMAGISSGEVSEDPVVASKNVVKGCRPTVLFAIEAVVQMRDCGVGREREGWEGFQRLFKSISFSSRG